MLNHIGTQSIKTERLLLRRFVIEDTEAMFRNWATDELTTKFLSWEPYTDIEKLREFLQKCIENYNNIEYYHWAIEFENEVIGTINIHAVSNKAHHGELGYCLGSKWWKKGFMTEAVKAVMQFAFTEVNFHKICALHDTENISSGLVMQKCGMTKEGLLREHSFRKDGTYGDFAFYGLLQSEWLENQK